MLRSELTEQLTAKFPQHSLAEIAGGMRVIVDSLIDGLSQGNRIEIRGFGTFSLRYHGPRKAHNPKTGKQLITKAKYLPHFKPGKILRERVR